METLKEIKTDKLSVRAEELEFVPDNYIEPFDFSKIFEKSGPVQIDVGCGDGAFLVAMAHRFPAYNFLGIERLLGRVRRTCRRAVKQDLNNVRLLRMESAYAMKYLFPAEIADIIHISFPDPWPKRRHKVRRLVTADFLADARKVLRPGGEIRMTTDDADYFKQMQAVSAETEGLKEVLWEVELDYPMTDFEKHYRSLNLPIYRLKMVKV